MRIPRAAIAALAAAALAAAAAAQDGAPAPAPADWAKRFEAAAAALAREEEEFVKAWEESRSSADAPPAPPDMTKHPGVKHRPEFLEIARGAKGTEPGVRAAAWLLGRGSGLPGGEGLDREAFRLLVEDGADCPALAREMTLLRGQHPRLGAEAVETALLALATKSADAEVRASAAVQRAAWRLEDPKASPERRAEGRRIAEEVVAKQGGTRAARRARGILTEQDRLQVGKEAPDFEAVDVDGAAFRLSGYRGHVVIVDFWSGWGRSARAHAPAWRAAAARWKDRPFAFVSVYCDDGGAEEARKAATEIGVPGRLVAAGGREGDLPVSWNVRALPTLYLLDADGVVRWKGTAGPFEPIAEECLRAAEARRAAGK